LAQSAPPVTAGSPAATAASPGGAATTAVADNGATAVTEFVVTGSRIPQPNLTSIAPVTSVSNAELKLSGTTRVEDLINSLPQAVADQGGNLSNGSSGTADISLRNLGGQRTLVLIDGRRLVPGDPASPFADINFIPAALIDRIEVDLAGASSVYGSDAVAGVVNFIMKRDFEGVRLDVNSGIYQNNNGNTAAQQANQAAGFPVPTGSVTDGLTVDVTAIVGANSPDGKGNVEGYVSYRHIDPVLQASRDYSACSETIVGAALACRGSETSAGGTFLIYGPGFSVPPGASSAPAVTLDKANPGNFRPFNPATDLYNFAPLNYYQRPDERYSGGFFAQYDISKQFQAYSEFMFMDDHTVSQVAPSGAFGFTYTIPCNDPLLSVQEVATICGTYGLGPTQANSNVILLRRNVEGGPRLNDLRHTDYRALIGLKGDLNDNWHYDVYGQYGASIFADNFLNDVSKTKLARALDVVPDTRSATLGQPVCQSVLDGTDPSCVPWNIFTPGGVTPAAVNYINTPGFQEGQTTEQVVSGAITGNLGDYGLKSPYAHEGIGVAFGAEYRRETSELKTDQEFTTGDLAGQGGPTLSTVGAFDVKELFAEARVPLIEDAPFAKSLNLDVGYRFAHYSLAGDNSTYKITGDWAITDDIRVRGGFNRAVRAPDVFELFTPQHIGNDGATDGCAGQIGSKTLVFSPAQCANTGVSAAQYGHITPNPAPQYFGEFGGNPALKPESSNTYSVGVVLTPHHLLPGFSFSADYFNIKITDVIQGFGADNILDTCATTGDPFFCNLVHRAAGTGSLFLGTTIIGAPTSGYIVDIIQNAGFLKTSGIDFAAGYKTSFKDMGMGDWGGVAFDFLGTYTHDYQVFSGIPSAPVLQCVGAYGIICQGGATPQSGPLPSFRSKVRLTYTPPLNGFEVSVNWRYIGPSNNNENQGPCVFCHIEAYNYFDLAAQYRFRDRYTLRAGVNNVFDRDPPIISASQLPSVSSASGNTYPQVYDPLGRFLFVGLTADF
ncbi:MAG: TonB-dependent receptor, partial [Pseudomonadota bacterium]|nr:TonB-dependent receptor [Pseudomonadota bacterium]